MKTTNRVLSVILCTLILLSVIMSAPFSVAAEVVYTFESDGVRYLESDNSTLCVVGVNSDVLPENVVIPSTVQDKIVTEVGERAFSGTKIKSITLPETVVVIGKYAFSSCSELETVDITGDLSVLDYHAFAYCTSLMEITLPDSLLHIGEGAFMGCTSLMSVYLPKNLETVGDEAFMRCSSIKKITINPALHTIGVRAFYELYALTEVVFEERTTLFSVGDSAFSSCMYLKDFDFTYCFNIGTGAFRNCNSLTSVVLPDDIDVTLGGSAFSGCSNLKTAKLSDNIDAIPAYCFSGCNKLKSVQTGRINLVYSGAFDGCLNLTDISFANDNDITRIYESAFRGCSNLAEISLPKVKYINIRAFENCNNLVYVNLEGNTTLKTIAPWAFYNCKSLLYIDIPASCNKIEMEAFKNCESLCMVDIKSGLKEIGHSAFFNCHSLYSFTVPKSVKSIGDMALGCFWKDHQNYVYGDFVVIGVESSLADEYADKYQLYWALNAPKLSSIENTSSGIKITFSKASGASSGKYDIYRCTETSEWKKIGTTTSLTYTDKTAKAGTTYYYTVQFVGKPTNSINDIPLEIVRLNTPSVSKIENTNDGAKITINAVAGAAKYRVYVRSDSKWKSLGVTDTTTFTHTGAKSGKTYKYTVRAYDASGKYYSVYNSSGFSNKFVAPPKITKLSNTATGIKITWDKVAGAEKYRVFVKSGSKWKKLKDTTSISYTHTSVESGKAYTYTVRCISSTGKSYKSGYDTVGTSRLFLATPVVKSISNTIDGAKITFTAVEGAARYNVYAKSGSSWNKIGETTETTFVHDTAKSGTTYSYRLRAYDETGEYVSYYKVSDKNTFIAAPVIKELKCTSKGVKITWDKVTGAEKYRVFIKSGSKWKKLKDTTSTSYTHTSVDSGKTYTYTVRCISSTGKSYKSGYDTVGKSVVYEK